MNKRKLYTILSICISTILWSQKEKAEFTFDAGMSYMGVDLTERLEMQYGLGIKRGNHNLRIAPIIQTYSSEAQNAPNNIKLNGAALNYLFCIETQFKKLDLLFGYEVTLQRYENEWEGTFFDDVKQEFIVYQYESKEAYSANTLGYGFAFKIIPCLEVRSMIEVGVYLSSFKGEKEGNSVQPVNQRIDFRGYDDFGFVWKSNIRIVYTF